MSAAVSSADGIHAHVERRVDGVRESALGPVELHARDAEVEQDGVHSDVVRRQLVEHGRESPRRNRAWTRARLRKRSKYARADGSRSMAMKRPLPRRSSGEQLGVAAGAERRVDDGVAGLDVEQAPHLVGENRNVISRAWPQGVRQHPPPSLRRLSICVAPRGAIPDLEMVVDTGHDDVALEAGMAWRARAGIITRPCLSGVTSEAPEKKWRWIMRSSRLSEIERRRGAVDEALPSRHFA